jgi:hypothetical protein
MSTESSAVVDALATWVCRRLPALNTAAREGEDAALSALLSEGGARAMRLDADTAQEIDSRARAIAIGDIGMIIASAIRHGVPESDERVTPMIQHVAALARTTDHPPRDSIYTYILWNGIEGRGLRLFTDHPFEVEFVRASATALAHYRVAADACREIDLRASDAFERLERATNALTSVRAQYQSMFERFHAERPAWFRDDYKAYFPSFVVDGTRYDPPSGANAADVLELDLMVGSSDEQYRHHIEGRLHNLISADRHRLDVAMTRPSIAAQMEVSADIASENLRQLGTLLRLMSQAAAAHFALIHSYLVPPGTGPARAESATVMSYGEVFRIMNLRLHNKLLDQIDARLRAIGPK